MNSDLGAEAVRLRIVDGKLKMETWPVRGQASTERSPDWGSLYPVCHIAGDNSGAERVSDRVEGVAQQAYHRAPGGVTNRLRQALKYANRYLYLRNRVRGEGHSLLAAVACVAIRGTDAYASGVGSHAVFIVGRGRVRSFIRPLHRTDLATRERARSDRWFLGLRADLSDAKFSYRQTFPGDWILVAAGDDVDIFQRLNDELAAIIGGAEIDGAARSLAGAIGETSNLSVLLMRLGSGAARLQVQGGASGTASSGRLSSLSRMLKASRGSRKSGDATADRVRLQRRTLPDRRERLAYQHESPIRQVPGSESTAGTGRRGGRATQATEQRGQELLEQSVQMSRLAGTVVVSGLCALLMGSRALLRSSWQFARRVCAWFKQHRVLQRLARGVELAILAAWAAAKGLVVRILPERQGSVATYGASARPMARAKVLGFHPSRGSRLAISALILLGVVLAVAASAVRVKSRLEQTELETVTAQVEEVMLLAEQEDDREARLGLLSQARDLIHDATPSLRDNTEFGELSARVRNSWDGDTGTVRIPFAVDEGPAIADGGPHRMVVHEDKLYVLDVEGQRIYRYLLDQDGKPASSQEPWIWDLEGEPGNAGGGPIVDIAWADAANGRLTPALLVLTTEGSLLELSSAGATREASITGTEMLQDPRAIETYYGNLYVLDLERENVLKYVPTGDDYQQPPVDYFQVPPDIDWAKVVDMAIDGYVYLLLSDGSVAKFAGGQAQPFPQEGLYPGLENPVAMFATPGSSSVWVAEPEQRRIVEFSTTGQFTRQFGAITDYESPLQDLRSFTIDLGSERLFVGTSTGVPTSSVPPVR